MTYGLEPGRHRVTELAERYSTTGDDDIADAATVDLLAVALVETSTLQGDDSRKYRAMRYLVAALARHDAETDAETVVELDDENITVHRSPEA